MLNLYSKRLLIFKLLYIQQALCLPVENDSQLTYDQRQNGKYNIHISIKDVAIIEVDKNEFVDDTITNADEYYYDDDDLTIKPISTWLISTTTTIKTPPYVNISTEELNGTSNQEVNVLNSPSNINATNTSYNLILHSSSSSTQRSIAPELHLEMEPVLHNQKATQVNIPLQHPAQRGRQHVIAASKPIPNKFRREKEINSTILNVLTTKPLSLQRLVICKNNYVADINGNCRKKRRSSFLKSFLEVLKFMRIKEI